jgi:sec-independent protein translocase protein TatA
MPILISASPEVRIGTKPQKESIKMLGFHWPELLVVMMFALLIFGPKRLPEMGNAIGKTVKEFRKSFSEVAEQAKAELPAPQPLANHMTLANAVEPASPSDLTPHA